MRREMAERLRSASLGLHPVPFIESDKRRDAIQVGVAGAVPVEPEDTTARGSASLPDHQCSRIRGGSARRQTGPMD